MPVTKIYTADKIFTGTKWLTDHAVLVQDETISQVLPVASLHSTNNITHFAGATITPALIDIQLYGAYGKLFSVFPSIDALTQLKNYCAAGGAAFCLPTVATNNKPVFYKCIDAIREYWDNGGTGILGLHAEGPWINTARRGAHIESLIHSPTIEEVQEFLAYGEGVIKMITLAPEVCDPSIIKLIVSRGIIVSAGHSNATYEQAKAGFQNGITAVTHLYNAMSPLQHRSPGLVGATMDDDNVLASIIPDTYHVDFAAIRIAKKIMGERLFAITDAVTDTESGAYPHIKSGDKYEAGGILSGSALNMIKAVQNLVSLGGIELGEALRMCSLYPAKVLRLSNLGKIEENAMAKMMVIDEALQLKQLI